MSKRAQKLRVNLMKYIKTFILLLLVSSCQKNKTNSQVTSLQDILGYTLNCTIKNSDSKGELLILSPHIIATWSPDKDNTLEYFKVVHVDKKQSIYFESILTGESNLKTIQHTPEANSNRRLVISLSDNLVKVTIINGLEGSNKKPINPIKLTCLKEISLSSYFDTK